MQLSCCRAFTSRACRFVAFPPFPIATALVVLFLLFASSHLPQKGSEKKKRKRKKRAENDIIVRGSLATLPKILTLHVSSCSGRTEHQQEPLALRLSKAHKIDAMEVNPLPTPPSTALSTRLKQQQLLLQREQSLRTPPISTGKAFRDVRQRRSPPTLARDGDKSSTVAGPGGIRSRKLRLRTSPNLLPSTLLPVSERKSQEDIPSWRIKKGSQEEDKFDIAPDGGSAGREGRQFAVANVGNNGRIYLR